MSSQRVMHPEQGVETSPKLAPSLEIIGRSTSGVAHDFNNLLTGIRLYSDSILEELVARRLPNRERLAAAAEEIRQTCNRGTALIEQLLAVARPGEDEPGSVSWNETILGIRNLLQHLIGRNIELIPNLAADLKPVNLTRSRAEQVILNLVLNARDAMPEGGKIWLQTRNCSPKPETLSFRRNGHQKCETGNSKRAKTSSTAQVELLVTDNGSGMAGFIVARAFEPFFTTKRIGKGTGLGLATVEKIVRDAGGTISLNSAPGQGTCVRIALAAVDYKKLTDFAESKRAASRARETQALSSFVPEARRLIS